MLAAGADTIVLGCTHFPFLAAAIQDLVGSGVRIIDPGEAVARRVEEVLVDRVGGSGSLLCFSSGCVHEQKKLMSSLLEEAVDVMVLPESCHVYRTEASGA